MTSTKMFSSSWMRSRRDVSGIFLYKIFVEKSIRITSTTASSCICPLLGRLLNRRLSTQR